MTDRIRRGVSLPLFGELAEPTLAVELAVVAEDAGWDGLFVWDHIIWRSADRPAADPWLTLAAIAVSTSTITLGPLVTPLARRRPVKVARESVTLDRLAEGRLVLGVGLGSDAFAHPYPGEFAATGEQTDDRTRAAMLDESLDILTAAWAGERLDHHGEHYRVDGLTFRPAPVQQRDGRPRVPVWVAGLGGNRRPLRRAARYDGFVPVNLSGPDQLAASVAEIGELRGDRADPYDVAVVLGRDADPGPYADAGATWLITEFDPEDLHVEQVRNFVAAGPVA